jgi:hypothetical protein
MGDALDAPATEAEVDAAVRAAAVVGVDAAVAFGDTLEQEDRSVEGNAERSLEEEEKNYTGQYRLQVKEDSFRNQAENLWNLERGCVMANHRAALSGCTAF